MYGEDDDLTKFPTYVINSCARNKLEIKLTKGEQKRDFIYIDDVVEAYSVIFRRLNGFNFGFNELEIGSGHAITIREFVETVKEITKSNTKLKFGALPYRPDELMFSKAKTDFIISLGWSKRYCLREGIIRTVRRDQNRVFYATRNLIESKEKI